MRPTLVALWVVTLCPVALAAPEAEAVGPAPDTESVPTTPATATAPPPPSKDHFLPAIGATAAFSTVTLVAGTFAWWRDKGYAGWGWRDTGFFGRDTYAGGADKAGHFISCYGATRLMTTLYHSLGVEAPNDLWLGAGFIWFLGAAVETVDGFTAFGFEYPDLIANTAGVVAGILAEKLPAVDALVGYRIGYLPTPHYLRHDKSYIRTINDYGGMIYYVDVKPAGLETAWGLDPGPARYLSFGVTFNTHGYSPKSEWRKERNVGLHVSLNVSEILLGAFEPGTFGVEGLARVSRYYAWPFTSVIYVRDLNNDDDTINFGVANRDEKHL
ncbi:MAG: DUF2279 domain-containing protein [Deltaproteobacteria bacterium]|nr:DUF2279 domain-containing protein [Deltaproteobacteria bacterium]